jgi:glyoxylase-like metal-dependent hydrolase (beta-lactamase superfamily II)
MAFVLHEERMVFTGDALFRGSIGRTDLPGGNYDQLIKSIRTQILTLDDLYEVLPGHGDTTSVGEEKMYNGFLQ